jgi:hypothetical protein
MRRALSTLPLLSLLAFAPACDSEETDMGDDFRGTTGTLDINIQLEQADGGEEDGTILWEIVEAEVYEGPAVNGILSLYIKDNAIHTAEGVQTCTINSPYLNSNVREVIAANGSDVLFSVWNEYVFEGKLDVKNLTYGAVKKLFGTQLIFEFYNNDVFLDQAAAGFQLLHATGNVENSSDGRKLLIAALITGECGGSGMPGYTF